MSKPIITILLLAVSFFQGIWWGEDTRLLAGFSTAALVSLGALVVVAVFSVKKVSRRILLAVSVVFVTGLGNYVGGNVASKAFSDCISEGENVRAALAEYRKQHGGFPGQLEDLGRSLPGRRLFRANLLEYRRVGPGYEMSFGDWLMVHRASDAEPFTAYK